MGRSGCLAGGGATGLSALPGPDQGQGRAHGTGAEGGLFGLAQRAAAAAPADHRRLRRAGPALDPGSGTGAHSPDHAEGGRRGLAGGVATADRDSRAGPGQVHRQRHRPARHGERGRATRARRGGPVARSARVRAGGTMTTEASSYQRLREPLAYLKWSTAAERLGRELDRAIEEKRSPTQVLESLLQAEVQETKARRQRGRLRFARNPSIRT